MQTKMSLRRDPSHALLCALFGAGLLLPASGCELGASRTETGAGRAGEDEGGHGLAPSGIADGGDGGEDGTKAGAAEGVEGGPEAGSDAGFETGSETGSDAGAEEDPWPQPPEGYGALQFPAPAPSPEDLNFHGLAGYEVVAIYSKPEMDAEKLGFLRIGARLRTSARVEGKDCKKGWHALEGGGFACASKGWVVDERAPFMKYQPAPPAMDAAFPYEWAYVRKWNSPMWWRPPTADERVRATARRAELEAERTGEPLEAPEGKPAEAKPPEAKPDSALPDVTAKKDGAEAVVPSDPSDPSPGELQPGEPAPQESATEVEPPPKLPLSPAHPWLEKGFFLSLGESVKNGGRSYWRTARGAYVEKSDVYKYQTKDFQGAEISKEMSFPVGFVIKKGGTTLYEFEEDKLVRGKKVDKRTFLDLSEQVEHGGKIYMTTTEGALVRRDHLRIPSPQPLPEGLDPWERWIDVDLTTQLLVAYEGTRPVYVTLVSTGRKGTKEEPFVTPQGRWRVYSKQVTSNMDGSSASDGNYAIQDVPWVMYFDGSYALHGAFWHRSFGHVRSHGCINLGPSDARWLFGWTTPFLPETWHGVHASEGNPGSTVIVHRSGA